MRRQFFGNGSPIKNGKLFSKQLVVTDRKAAHHSGIVESQTPKFRAKKLIAFKKQVEKLNARVKAKQKMQSALLALKESRKRRYD